MAYQEKVTRAKGCRWTSLAILKQLTVGEVWAVTNGAKHVGVPHKALQYHTMDCIVTVSL